MVESLAGGSDPNAVLTDLFASQQQTALAWRTSTADERVARLARLRAAILEARTELTAALRLDLGKPQAEADLSELAPVLSEIKKATGGLRGWMKPARVTPSMTTLGIGARLKPEPRGRSLIIAPWNYPFSLSLGPLVSAIAAGCPVILKPSELSPTVSAVVRRIVRAAFTPEEAAVVEGDADVSAQLLALPFDHIFFTGSPRVGSIVMAAAAKNLATVTLELGGKSPTIVDASVDAASAARTIAWGKFFNCGQTCVAPDYVFVHESVADAFVAAMKTAIESYYSAAPQSSASYGRIVSSRHAARLKAMVEEAAGAGARLLHGGESDVDQRFVAPTLIDATGVTCSLLDEEIFGPVLPILRYADLGEAIAYVNARAKPLALYYFGRDKAAADRVLAQTSSGGACVNHCLVQFSHENLPFGGVTTSGHGRGHGRYGFEAFSHFKPVLDAKFNTAKMLFPPYDAGKSRIVAMMMKMLGA